jgi:hypothetical protein
MSTQDKDRLTAGHWSQIRNQQTGTVAYMTTRKSRFVRLISIKQIVPVLARSGCQRIRKMRLLSESSSPNGSQGAPDYNASHAIPK